MSVGYNYLINYLITNTSSSSVEWEADEGKVVERTVDNSTTHHNTCLLYTSPSPRD